MAIKVDVNKVKRRLEEEKAKIESRKKNSGKISIEQNFILKVPAAGTYEFRAIPYIHNENPEGNPFLEASYIYGVPGMRSGFYSPQENEGKPDKLLDFIWSQMKVYKGMELVKKWKDFLPKTSVFVPGILIGREAEGVKFLKLATTKNKKEDDKKKIDKVQCLYEFFTDSDEDVRNWMDPDKGFNLKLDYEENQEFGLCLAKGRLSLARKQSSIGKKGDYEKYLNSTPNLLEDKEINGIRNPFIRRTSEESEELLRSWTKQLGIEAQEAREKREKANPDLDVSGDLDFPPSDDVEGSDDLQNKLEALQSRLSGE